MKERRTKLLPKGMHTFSANFPPPHIFFIAAAKLFIFESCMSHPLPFKVAILSCKKEPKNVEGVESDKRSLMILDIPSDFSHSYHPYWNTVLFICELNHMTKEWPDRALGLAHDGLWLLVSIDPESCGGWTNAFGERGKKLFSRSRVMGAKRKPGWEHGLVP